MKRNVAVRAKLVAVDSNSPRLRIELSQSTVHGLYRGLQYIDTVDLFGRHHSYCPGYGLGFYKIAQLHAPALAELF